MKKRIIISITIIAFLAMLPCNITKAFAAEKKPTNLIAAKKVSYTIKSHSYKYKGIKISYPQISNLGNTAKQKKINSLIKSEALKELKYSSKDLNNLTMNISYNIKLNSKDLLSIHYLGMASLKNSAHPSNLFYTTNIDLNKASRIVLGNIVNIDENFIKKVKAGTYKKWSKDIDLKPGEAVDSINTLYTDSDLINSFKAADSLEKGFGIYSYLTKDSLGISIQISHAMGDHIEFEVKYKDLKDNTKKNNILWKYLNNK